jgi:hypothetical protein
MPSSANYRRRADEYRALAAKVADAKERQGLLSLATLLDTLAENEAEREEGRQQPTS